MVFCTFFCDIPVLAIFFAVLRCSEPPNVPLQMIYSIYYVESHQCFRVAREILLSWDFAWNISEPGSTGQDKNHLILASTAFHEYCWKSNYEFCSAWLTLFLFKLIRLVINHFKRKVTRKMTDASWLLRPFVVKGSSTYASLSFCTQGNLCSILFLCSVIQERLQII